MALKERIELLIVALCRMLGITINMNCAGVIVKDENGKVLLVQEKMNIHGIFEKWNVPMGRIERDESSYSCALREGGEETGYRLILKDINHFYSWKDKVGPIRISASIYSAKIVGGQLRVPPDMLDVKWFSLEEVLKLDEEEKLISAWVRYVAQHGA